MLDTVKERLSAYLEYKGVSKSEFGRTIGVSSAYVSSMRKSIQPDKLALMAVAYTDLNTDWLLTGIGEMLKSDEESNVELLGRAHSPIMEDTVEVRFFDVNPTATFQDFCESASEAYDTTRIIPLRGERLDDSYCVFEIHGDSMAPTVLSHSRILCKNIPPQQWHHADGVIVIAYASKVVLKRVKHNDLDGGNLLTLTSDNPDYGSEVVQLADIHCIYKAKRIVSQDIY